MTPFNFYRPATLDDAIGVLAQAGSDAKIIAGGQSLLLALKERQKRPSSVISIADVPGLSGATELEDGSRDIGPCTTYAKLAKMTLPGWQSEISSVAGNLADRSVRNMGTIGGAVCEAGIRFDVPTLLSGIEAMFKLTSVQGVRMLSADAFFNASGGTNIAPDEILTGITVPPLPYWSAVAFEKFRFRTFDAAIVTVAGAIALAADGTIERLRLVVGGVAKAPSIATGVTETLKGQNLAALSLAEIAQRVSAEVLPPDKAVTRAQKYQAELTISLATRVLTRLSTGALPA
ncbi:MULTISPECIES: xanthine dehydrogenase family protein subunit M [unclassified Hyphomicrobium]|uniref:FAD binding domain-containing protein n=1 Tax=unclassified Hyphomicrobium TaxID=2619925 RepID=UPI000213F84A|nr:MULTISPECIES: FAD binding domain-containing protein [unclassified Hyphomicrobium]CCB63421.1 putative Aldehyde dehydrogenase, middle subunit [Hyphomicrobium sp. MC1]